jgi:glycosyltransferase involved in cell wall biosynthesis
MPDRLSAAALGSESSGVKHDLTIVIPAFRCAAYLPAAVASALHSPARHILIAEDAGGDDTLEVAERLAAEYPGRIRVLSSPVNRGAAVNVNEAAKRIETPFFAKLDGDDVLIPGYLESVFPLIALRPQLAVLAGRERRIGADEAVTFQPDLLPKVRRATGMQIMSGAEAYRFIVKWDPNPTSSGVIYRTDMFREIGGFDPQITWGEDWEIWLRLARKWEVAYIPSPSALYRIHSQSATAKAIGQNRLCYGYDLVLRRAAEICAYPEVFPLIRRRMLAVARLYVAAAARGARTSRRHSIRCAVHALRTLFVAFGTRVPTVSSAWASRALSPLMSGEDHN